MAGEYVPVVMLPRYTSYVGAATFTTIAMDVSQYEKAVLSVWRGPMIGTIPTIGFTFEELTDQETYTTCSGVAAGVDPGSGNEAQYQPVLTKKWFRVKVVLGGTNPSGSCWAMGFLERRQA